jgi:hypothetical protein
MGLRRPLYLALLALTALIVAAPAAADKPLRFPSEPFDVTFEAGELCPFRMSWVDETNRSSTKVFLDKDGEPRFLLGSGQIVTTITNLENGESVTLNISGPGRITLNEDGSQTIVGMGPWLIGFFPTDVPAGPALIYTHGRFTLHVGPTGVLTLVEAPPRMTNICTLLAD